MRSLCLATCLVLLASVSSAEEADHAIHEELRALLTGIEQAINASKYDNLVPFFTEHDDQSGGHFIAFRDSRLFSEVVRPGRLFEEAGDEAHSRRLDGVLWRENSWRRQGMGRGELRLG